MGDKFRAIADNLVSRAVGFVVRLFALITAIVIMSGYAVFGGLLLVIWPVLPLLGPALIVGGML
jgi:hypothetical protein